MKKVLIALVMLGMAASASAVEFNDLPLNAADLKAMLPAESAGIPSPEGMAVEEGSAVPIEWLPIPGGKFMMGTENGATSYADTRPVHKVTISNFEMAKTAVTVEQYAQCVYKGLCTKPATGGYCNWGKPGRQRHPVNCVSWYQAKKYADFIGTQPGHEGARLPSESEWEYAATGLGATYQRYPWGSSEPTCRKAVMHGKGRYHCGNNDGTMPVCSKPDGNTEQGLCDMAGNVFQWVQDKYKSSYLGAPADGSAYEGEGSAPYSPALITIPPGKPECEGGSCRVVRGGSPSSYDSGYLAGDYRGYGDPAVHYTFTGFRLARSGR
ncbi:MAG TPA: hypothetical protein DCZ93_02795 [Elusimicrobia bacterium]|nr:hypothetical protein [Elusimicrobiota bacterium]